MSEKTLKKYLRNIQKHLNILHLIITIAIGVLSLYNYYLIYQNSIPQPKLIPINSSHIDIDFNEKNKSNLTAISPNLTLIEEEIDRFIIVNPQKGPAIISKIILKVEKIESILPIYHFPTKCLYSIHPPPHLSIPIKKYKVKLLPNKKYYEIGLTPRYLLKDGEAVEIAIEVDAEVGYDWIYRYIVEWYDPKKCNVEKCESQLLFSKLYKLKKPRHIYGEDLISNTTKELKALITECPIGTTENILEYLSENTTAKIIVPYRWISNKPFFLPEDICKAVEYYIFDNGSTSYSYVKKKNLAVTIKTCRLPSKMQQYLIIDENRVLIKNNTEVRYLKGTYQYLENFSQLWEKCSLCYRVS